MSELLEQYGELALVQFARRMAALDPERRAALRRIAEGNDRRRGAARGMELALALLAGSAVLIALIVALDVLRFALPALLDGARTPLGHHDVALAVLARGRRARRVAARPVAVAPGAPRSAGCAGCPRVEPADDAPGAP